MGVNLVVFLFLLLSISLTAVAVQLDHGDWVKTERPDSDCELEVTFAIKRTNPGWLKDKLRAVSYPDSPEYGNYMNFDEIAKYVHGNPESVQALFSTLGHAGIRHDQIDFTIGQDFAIVKIPVQTAEELFSADFYIFQHKEQTEQKVIKTDSYTIPNTLQGHIDFVSGIADFPRPNIIFPRKSTSTNSVGVTPKSIETDYNISDYVSTEPNNSQAIASFLKQYFNPTDLETFQMEFDVPKNPIAKIVGENIADKPGVEAELDVQYITATGRKVTTWFVSTSTYANKGQEDFLSWIIGQVNDTTSPWVHSVSYGDYENSIPTDYQDRCDSEFMKFGISGRTILIATGDEGVHCKRQKFVPMWPTCSPYVTAVGGTASLTKVWQFGGGGFSNTYNMPDYQKEAVQAYLSSGKAPPTSYFNISGRAYPDISAFSTNYQVVIDALPQPVDGTSCSTPTSAGIVAILNDVRMKNGKKTLGFLNPLLYSLKGKGFIDITSGKNSGGGAFSCPGFQATAGWDPASGWGSPNFGLLKDLVVQ